MIGQARLLVVYASVIVHDCTKLCCHTIPGTLEVCMFHMCDIHVSLLGCVYMLPGGFHDPITLFISI